MTKRPEPSITIATRATTWKRRTPGRYDQPIGPDRLEGSFNGETIAVLFDSEGARTKAEFRAERLSRANRACCTSRA